MGSRERRRPTSVPGTSPTRFSEAPMPFKKITSGKNKGKFRSPSGRVMTKGQVRGYYATKGKRKK